MPLSRTGSGCCFFRWANSAKCKQTATSTKARGPLAKDYGYFYPSRLGYLAIYNTLRTYGYDMSNQKNSTTVEE